MQYPRVIAPSLLAVLLLLLASACGGPDLDDGDPGDAPSTDGGSTDAGDPEGDGGGPDGGADRDDGGTDPGDGGADAGDGTNDPGEDGGSTGSLPEADLVPAPTGACPTFADGVLTFEPDGLPARDVRVWVSEAADTLDGPLVFYWHGTGSRPEEAVYGLSQEVIDEITALGGIVAAPYSDPESGLFPWFLTTAYAGGRDDDLRVADEILGCALQEVGVDLRHVHSIGMSAGGLQTTQMSYRRSGYVASVVTWSGGLISPSAPASEDPSNAFAAMIFHGGPTDVVGISFQDASERYWEELTDHGHFAAICNHGGSHSIPTDAREGAWQFFLDHPFGTDPSPYADGLPAGFPEYCGLAP